jgi:hypothetical protein
LKKKEERVVFCILLERVTESVQKRVSANRPMGLILDGDGRPTIIKQPPTENAALNDRKQSRLS